MPPDARADLRARAGRLRLVADANIPHAEAAFAAFGAVTTHPGRALTPDVVRTADVLLVRSVTRVDAALLDGSRVRFVGSATAGTDHVDRAYLRRRGIAFAHAPGANATSVADYVVAALLALRQRTRTPLAGRTAGVVGCGAVGGRVARRLEALGLAVLRVDPPRAEAAEAAGRAHPFRLLADVLPRADVLTLHTPLTTGGPHPTHRLIGAAELAALPPGAWLLNTARGPVVDPEALRAALEAGALAAAALDVWDAEPTPDPALLRRVTLATPHVAGYAHDGKVRGTARLVHALADLLDAAPAWSMADALPPAPAPLAVPDPHLPPGDYLDALARQAYAVRADDCRLRASLDEPPAARAAFFAELRRTYPLRREMQAHRLAPPSLVPAAHHRAVADALTIRMEA